MWNLTLLATYPTLSATTVLPTVLILLLCVIAGIGTVLLLPSRREAAIRKIGGAVLLAAGLIFAAMLIHHSATAGAGGGMGIYFWVFSAIAIVGAIRVITHPRPVYSALYFVLTILASAGLFILLWAEFMAAALVIIYAGAILITYVFVIMLAHQTSAQNESETILTDYDNVSREPVIAAAVGFTLMGVLMFVIFDRAEGLDVAAADRRPAAGMEISTGDPSPAFDGSTQALGLFLFEHHLVSLELAGLILTLSMVGAIIIARRRVETSTGVFEPSVSETITALATPLDDNPHSIPVYGTQNPRQKAYPET